MEQTLPRYFRCAPSHTQTLTCPSLNLWPHHSCHTQLLFSSDFGGRDLNPCMRLFRVDVLTSRQLRFVSWSKCWMWNDIIRKGDSVDLSWHDFYLLLQVNILLLASVGRQILADFIKRRPFECIQNVQVGCCLCSWREWVATNSAVELRMIIYSHVITVVLKYFKFRLYFCPHFLWIDAHLFQLVQVFGMPFDFHSCIKSGYFACCCWIVANPGPRK